MRWLQLSHLANHHWKLNSLDTPPSLPCFQITHRHHLVRHWEWHVLRHWHHWWQSPDASTSPQWPRRLRLLNFLLIWTWLWMSSCRWPDRAMLLPANLEGLALTSLLVRLAIVDVMYVWVSCCIAHSVYICPVLINETSSGVKRDWFETIRDPRCTGNSAHTVHIYSGLINKTLINH